MRISSHRGVRTRLWSRAPPAGAPGPDPPRLLQRRSVVAPAAVGVPLVAAPEGALAALLPVHRRAVDRADRGLALGLLLPLGFFPLGAGAGLQLQEGASRPGQGLLHL